MQEGHQAVAEVLAVQQTDLLGVDGNGLLLVEARRVRVHVRNVEGLGHFLHGEDVAVRGNRPAQESQVVVEALGDHAGSLVQQQIRLGVALGQLLVALTHDVGQVAEARHELGDADGLERAVQDDLAGRRGEQVLAAQHVGDLHERVVDRVHQRVERVAVGAHDHVVRHRAGLEGDLAADQVRERDVLVGHAQAQDRLAALGTESGDLLLRQVTVEAVVAELGVLTLGAVTLLDLLGGRVGLVGVAGLEQAGGHVTVDVHALALTVGAVRASLTDALVPVEAQPLQGLDDLVEGFLGVAGGIRVFDTKDEGSSRVAGVGPVEQARTDHADVRGSCGRGAEADANVGTGGSCFTHDSSILLQRWLLHLLDGWARCDAHRGRG